MLKNIRNICICLIVVINFITIIFIKSISWAQNEPPVEGLEPIFIESFDGNLNDNWILHSNDSKLNWIKTNKKFDISNPSSSYSAKGIPDPPTDIPIKGYPPNVINWMVYKNPIDLSNTTEAEILFSYYPDFDQSARLGLCVGISSEPENLNNCKWYNQSSNMWQYVKFDLAEFVSNKSTIHIGWVFETGNGDQEKSGVYVDEIQILTAKQADQTPPQDSGWKPIYREFFGSVDISTQPGWTLLTNQTDINWSISELHYDHSDPGEPKSASAIPSPHKGYPGDLENWMIFGPLNLKDQKSIEIFFSYYIDTNSTDRLGFVVGNGNSKENFLPENIVWLTSTDGKWKNKYQELSLHAGMEGVFIGWVFRSKSGSLDKRGVFVDRIEVVATDQQVPPMFDHTDDFVQWENIYSEAFDNENLYEDPKWFSLKEQGDIEWLISDKIWEPVNPESLKSVAITSLENGYPKDIKTWMIYGPLDLSNMAYADAKFSILFDLEGSPENPIENNDRAAFFATSTNSIAEIPNKFQNIPKIVWWTGSSGNRWHVFHADLTPLAGQSNVYLAWYFESHIGSDSKQGIFVDELEIKGQNKDTEIPKIDFKDTGLRVQNGNFSDNSLLNWSLKDHGPGDGQINLRERKGDYFPEISGNQIFYQMVLISSEISDILISFSYAVTTTETQRGNDNFCIALTSENDTDNILIDLGCWDVVDFPDYAKTEDEGLIWDKYEKGLTDEQIETITASNENQVAFVIKLTQDESDTGKSILFLDNVNVYATGYSRRSTDDTTQIFASQRDPGEPNDSFNRATLLECGETFSGVFGDVGGGFDVDYYQLSDVPTGEIEIDIEAKTKYPPSASDSRLELFDDSFTLITKNDDDGITLDPNIIFDNSVENATYYIGVKNNHGGGPHFFYDLTVSCNESTESKKVSSYTTSKKVTRKKLKSLTTLQGDINGDNEVDIMDAIIGLKIVADFEVLPTLSADIDGDMAIDLKDVLFAFEITAGLREVIINEDNSETTWTMILFLNAEDQSCVNLGVETTCWDQIYKKSIQKIEDYIGEKKDFLTVIALIDGPNFDGIESDVTRYVIQPEGNYKEGENIFYLDEINMGDPDDFTDFVQWSMINYPADYYYVAIHDHGHGIFGLSWDHNDEDGSIDDYLTPPELRSALKEITSNGENKIDIFEYQACLMGLLENAYDIREYVEYISFFQPISWSSYNYPEYFKEMEQGDDPLTVGKRTIQNYPVTGDSFPYAFSLIDTGELETLREKLDDFAEVLMTSSSSEIMAARNESQAFNGNINKGDPTQDVIGYIDLWYLADRVSSRGIAVSEVESLKAAIEKAVLETKATLKGGDPLWDYSNFHGLSILYPMGNFSFLTDYVQNYQMGEDGKWDDFLSQKAFTSRKRDNSNDSRIMNIPEILEEALWINE